MSRKFDRFMLDVNIGTNRKLRRLTVPERWCHVAGVLAVAAQATVRGQLTVGNENADPSDYAELAGVPLTVARSTVEKLRAVGIIEHDDEHECERIHDWSEHNPEPKDPGGKDRQQAWRDRRRNALRNGERNGDVVTPNLRVVTAQGKRRETKRTEEQPSAAVACPSTASAA